MKLKRGYVKDLAAKCGVTPEHMSFVLGGHRRPSADLAELIEINSNGKFKKDKLIFNFRKAKTGAEQP